MKCCSLPRSEVSSVVGQTLMPTHISTNLVSAVKEERVRYSGAAKGKEREKEDFCFLNMEKFALQFERQSKGSQLQNRQSLLVLLIQSLNR